MIKKLLAAVSAMRDAAVIKAGALGIVSQSTTAQYKSRKLHKDIIAGRAPRGRTC
jgi:hypothetical protein